jgi:hypothetical protein
MRILLATRSAIVGLLVLLLFPVISTAQFDAATVLGTVRDSSGAVVPGATVTLKNAATGITATSVTDEHGDYQFFNARVGSYSVRAELQGFSVAEAENFAVTVNARQRVDLTLKPGTVGETVVVSGAAQLLETESSDRGRDQTRIEARIEAFNLFNTTNFGPANGNRSSSAFGTITSTSAARQIQLGLKFYF